MSRKIGFVDEAGPRSRAAHLNLDLGRLSRGKHNAITDVPGVQVGHCTITDGEGPLVAGKGPVRTGVTAIIPHGKNTFMHKVPAAVHVINGFGKAVGFLQIEECGVIETPILLTNTLNVGLVSDALIDIMLEENQEIGVTTGTVNPVVAECNDGFLNDIRGRHVRKTHVRAALKNARNGEVAEGSVGAGTGMMAFGWKGGIGSASRVVPTPNGRRYVLGILVLSNFGSPKDLMIGGWPVGRFLPHPPRNISDDHDDENRYDGDTASTTMDPPQNDEGDGSVVIVLATDAPLESRQLRRLAARSVVGLVRCGSRLAHGSGDYAIVFSTAFTHPHTMRDRPVGGLGSGYSEGPPPVTTPTWPDDGCVMADLLRAAGEATEEAVLNSLLQARTVVGRDGHIGQALPIPKVMDIIRRFTRQR